MAPTMKEVAARAGVSTKTVSRVVNDQPHISADVRDRVRRAIDDLGWAPNTHARSLRTGRTGLIALSLVDLTTPTAARLAQAVVREAERRGLQVSIEPSRGRTERIAQTLASRGALFDAVIHLGPLPEDLTPSCSTPEQPIVVLHSERSAPHGEVTVDTVDNDECAAADALARHLRMLQVGGAVLLGREDGVPDAFFERLLSAFPGAPVLRPAPEASRPSTHAADRSAGRRAAAAALARHPDARALLCADDELAIGALSLLRERDVDVPGRILLTGHGYIDDGQFSTPTVTTIDPDAAEIARRTVELVVARLGGDDGPPRRVVVPAALIRAESTLGRADDGGRGRTWRG
ncbi:LacI family DNA-binding transcriptional regulator [Brachybacterium sp. YJGR34]|uniref:LacI family DNA-binding transcriptional regulator n=1 Tax=Brachybacterium sp. YJGR34 TaxID=2059911 RepID=UPI000E0C85AD|nr:LacI family DNA-binding transcriptional regulator [Brachybacterium sp. YJGR34]